MLNDFILFSALLFALALIMTAALKRNGYGFTFVDGAVLGLLGVGVLATIMLLMELIVLAIRG